MTARLRTLALMLSTALLSVVLLGAPAGAQQIVDAGKEEQGGFAFVLMALMFGIIFAVLFSMDRIRKRRLDTDEVENQ